MTRTKPIMTTILVLVLIETMIRTTTRLCFTNDVSLQLRLARHFLTAMRSQSVHLVCLRVESTIKFAVTSLNFLRAKALYKSLGWVSPSVSPTTKKFEIVSCKLQVATYNMQHATCNLLLATCYLCNLQLATRNMQHATCNMQLLTFNV